MTDPAHDVQLIDTPYHEENTPRGGSRLESAADQVESATDQGGAVNVNPIERKLKNQTANDDMGIFF
jgi:hypothetical protein